MCWICKFVIADELFKRCLTLKYLLLIFARDVLDLLSNLTTLSLKSIDLLLIIFFNDLYDIIFQAESANSLSIVPIIIITLFQRLCIIKLTKLWKIGFLMVKIAKILEWLHASLYLKLKSQNFHCFPLSFPLLLRFNYS